ncbi:MAG: Rv3654c family TadE-like protein [Nocardioides sp.]
MRLRSERGSATLLVVALSGLLLSVTLALAGVGGLIRAHRSAQAAADLAALAAAVRVVGADPCGAAAEAADANGARLEACQVSGLVVSVQVAVPLLGPGSGVAPGVAGVTVQVRARARAGPG